MRSRTYAKVKEVEFGASDGERWEGVGGGRFVFTLNERKELDHPSQEQSCPRSRRVM